MRTLTLLAAILLLALQAQAEPLGQSADEVPAQDEPAAEDQYMSVSFEGHENSVQEASGLTKNRICQCRRFFCGLRERRLGSCTHKGRNYKFCCS
ncbi:corticostatin-3-like [Trichechus inunguis]